MGSTSGAVDVLSGIAKDLTRNIGIQAAELATTDGKKTLQSRDVIDAVRLLFPNQSMANDVISDILGVINRANAIKVHMKRGK